MRIALLDQRKMLSVFVTSQFRISHVWLNIYGITLTMLLLYQPYLFNSFHGILYLMDTTLQHNISIFTYCEQLNQDINSLLYAKHEETATPNLPSELTLV